MHLKICKIRIRPIEYVELRHHFSLRDIFYSANKFSRCWTSKLGRKNLKLALASAHTDQSLFLNWDKCCCEIKKKTTHRVQPNPCVGTGTVLFAKWIFVPKDASHWFFVASKILRIHRAVEWHVGRCDCVSHRKYNFIFFFYIPSKFFLLSLSLSISVRLFITIILIDETETE